MWVPEGAYRVRMAYCHRLGSQGRTTSAEHGKGPRVCGSPKEGIGPSVCVPCRAGSLLCCCSLSEQRRGLLMGSDGSAESSSWLASAFRNGDVVSCAPDQFSPVGLCVLSSFFCPLSALERVAQRCGLCQDYLPWKFRDFRCPDSFPWKAQRLRCLVIVAREGVTRNL